MTIKKNLTKIVLAGVVGLGLTTNGVSEEEDYRIDPQSPFAKECVAYNLDPQSTSEYELYAVKLGLPVTATPDEIIERKFGFNPNTLSNTELQQRLKQLGYNKVQDLYSHLLE
ncbi:MAG: hypothetical protein IIA85_03380 [Nanoarchaeota archaeon]|nr:hypothetical protein [Nanoarchaeota archaeon]